MGLKTSLQKWTPRLRGILQKYKIFVSIFRKRDILNVIVTLLRESTFIYFPMFDGLVYVNWYIPMIG